MSWRTTAYRAVRPLLFAFDPESIHHATLDGCWPPVGDACRARLGVRGDGRRRTRSRSGPALPQPGRAWRGSTRTALPSGAGRRSASGSSSSARSRRGRRRATRGRGSPPCRATARSSTAWASTTPAPMRCRRIARRATAPARWVRDRRQHRSATATATSTTTRRRPRAVADVADYLAINVSSPNTPGACATSRTRPARRAARHLVREAAPRRRRSSSSSPRT